MSEEDKRFINSLKDIIIDDRTVLFSAEIIIDLLNIIDNKEKSTKKMRK